MDYRDLLDECRDSAKEKMIEAKELTSELVMDIAGKLSAAAQGEQVRISNIVAEVARATGKDFLDVRKFVRNTLATEGWEVSLMTEKTFKIAWQNLDEPHGELRHFSVDADNKELANAKAIETLKRDGVPEELIEIKAVELDESKVNEEEFAEPSMRKPGTKPKKKLHKKIADPEPPEELDDPKLDLEADEPEGELAPDEEDKPKALPDTDQEPEPSDPDVPPPPEEVLEPEQPIEMRKEYLGKTDDTHYYFVTTEGEGGEIADFVLVDQEGAKKFSAEDNDIEIREENIAQFIIDAIRDVKVASIERSVFMKYIYPKLIEESPSEEEFLEEPGEPEDKGAEEQSAQGEEQAGIPAELPRESKVKEQDVGAWRKATNKPRLDKMKAKADKDKKQVKENSLIETKVTDDAGNEFTVYLLDEGGTDTVIEVNGRKFNFSQEFASMWRDDQGVLSEAGLKELALDALSNLGEEEHAELVSQATAEEPPEEMDESVKDMEAELDVLSKMSMSELLDAVGESRKDLPEKEDLIDELMLRKFGKEYSSYLKRQVGIESKENNEGVSNMNKEEMLKLAEEKENEATDAAKGVKALIKLAKEALHDGDYAKLAEFATKLAEIEANLPAEAEEKAEDEPEEEPKDEPKEEEPELDLSDESVEEKRTKEEAEAKAKKEKEEKEKKAKESKIPVEKPDLSESKGESRLRDLLNL
jgi:hypothetical protein